MLWSFEMAVVSDPIFSPLLLMMSCDLCSRSCSFLLKCRAILMLKCPNSMSRKYPLRGLHSAFYGNWQCLISGRWPVRSQARRLHGVAQAIVLGFVVTWFNMLAAEVGVAEINLAELRNSLQSEIDRSLNFQGRVLLKTVSHVRKLVPLSLRKRGAGGRSSRRSQGKSCRVHRQSCEFGEERRSRLLRGIHSDTVVLESDYSGTTSFLNSRAFTGTDPQSRKSVPGISHLRELLSPRRRPPATPHHWWPKKAHWPT